MKFNKGILFALAAMAAAPTMAATDRPVKTRKLLVDEQQVDDDIGAGKEMACSIHDLGGTNSGLETYVCSALFKKVKDIIRKKQETRRLQEEGSRNLRGEQKQRELCMYGDYTTCMQITFNQHYYCTEVLGCSNRRRGLFGSVFTVSDPYVNDATTESTEPTEPTEPAE